MQLGLDGRAAVVTGGSKGLGRAIARELLSEGAKVAICARNNDELQATREELAADGATVVAMAADVTDPDSVAAFIAFAAEQLGGIDMLVNNAGGARPGRFDALGDGDWQIDLDTKLFSIIRTTRAALPYLRSGSRASVVNIGAVQGKAPDPVFCSTSTIRAAGNNLTKVLAQQLGPENIRVNGVNIGLVTTPQWENIRSRNAPSMSLDEYTANLAQTEVPLGRFGRDDEVSGVVTFLLSDRASYVTGAFVDVAGGMGKYT